MTTTINDKNGRPIDIDDCPNGWSISPRQRDTIYQAFLRAFRDAAHRKAILKEFEDIDDVRARAQRWFDDQAVKWPVSADRIRAFVTEAVATEAGILPKSERWDWWVGCSQIQ